MLSVMSTEPPPEGQPLRYCLDCGYLLTDFDAEGTCSECGRGFDARDPRSTGRRSSTFRNRRVIDRIFKASLVLTLLVFIADFVIAFMGGDAIVVFLIAFFSVPVLIILPITALVPSLDLRLRTRIIAFLLPILVVSIAWPANTRLPFENPFWYWPFDLSFALHQSAVESFATRIRAGEIVETTTRIGVLNFFDHTFAEDNLGLQLTGGKGGGIHLVQTVPGCRMIWWNTNWEKDLGGGWFLVEQD